MSPKCVRIVSGEFFLNDSGFTIKLKNPDLCIEDYINNILINIQDRIYKCGKGAAQKNINFDSFLNLKIPLPPLEIQKEIVEELEQYQKVIDGAKQVVDNYKPHFEIDESWEKIELVEICDNITDGSHFSPKTSIDGYPYITVKDITDYKIDFENCKFISQESFEKLSRNGCKPKRDDVLFSKDGTVGKTYLVDHDIDFVVLSSLAIITPIEERILPQFLFYYLSSKRFINEATKNKTGVAIRRIVLKTLKKIQIHLPELNIQNQIVQKLDEERKIVDGNKELIEIYSKKIEDRINKIWGE
jgi:restriction endonuclease S subunit